MSSFYIYQTNHPSTGYNTMPDRCSIFTLDSIIPAVNCSRSKIPIYQYNPFLNLSDLLVNLKLMSGFTLTNLTKTKSNFILSISPSITNVSIVSFMETLEEIDNECNESFQPLSNNCNSNMFHISCKPSHIFIHLMKMCKTV